MKILRIKNQQGEYSLDGSNYKAITLLNKEDLLTMINTFVSVDCEMDEYTNGALPNRAQQIIYSNLYMKFKDLEQHKSSFKDIEENMYKKALEKYKVSK